MNERIQELVLKARGQATSDTKDGGKCFDLDLFHKKFAELIVKECVAICQDVDGEDNIDARSGRQDCAVEIREHFGVEE
jgi:hypothetical protein